MKYYLDTEFDGWKGCLLSMALVREDGEARYWVLVNNEPTEEWVLENVEPHIHKGPAVLVCSEADLSREIYRFLKKDEDIEICCDWPDDIKYFCDVIVFGPGKCRGLKRVRFTFDRTLGDYSSKVPHNAYYDAVAMLEKDNAPLA